MFKELGRELQKRQYDITLHESYLVVKVSVEVHQNAQKCFMANYTFGYKGKVIHGGPIMMNGPGESKLIQRLRRDVPSLIRFEESKKRGF
jgi:hypothetical protein